MSTLNFDVTTETPGLVCVECDYAMDATSGPDKPHSGDATLCIRCGSLNIFDEQMRLRRPTIEEYLEAAADRDVQRTRRAILSVSKEDRDHLS